MDKNDESNKMPAKWESIYVMCYFCVAVKQLFVLMMAGCSTQLVESTKSNVCWIEATSKIICIKVCCSIKVIFVELSN